uniref:Glucose-methanol-choline oxidoreductase N-terminal domain-containing protein n=1 Tax=Strigamia maritima TaxID=126957 RepID=T1J979_STRMM
GAGAAGAAIAARLSEKEKFQVLLLEAGGEPPFFVQIPYLSMGPFGGEYDWSFKWVIPRGKGLGGSTLINGLVFTRGNKNDYDHWQSLGNDGWSYNDLLPYFKKLEDYQIPLKPEDEIIHSKGGPVTATVSEYKTPLQEIIFDAFQETGYSLQDYNGQTQTGYFHNVAVVRNGSRCDAYTSYLEPNRNRANLHIVTHAFVTKVKFDDKNKAVGVYFEKDNKIYFVPAEKEVILASGSNNSPHLLMLSGIGPKEMLEKYKIKPVTDSPGVGGNLQDHATVAGMVFVFDEPIGFDFSCDVHQNSFELWHSKRQGVLTVPIHSEAISFLKTKFAPVDKDWPDFELQIVQPPAMPDNLKNEYKKPFFAQHNSRMMVMLPILMRPKSVGHVRLQSGDPHVPLAIQPNYLSNEDDVNVLLEVVKAGLNLTRTQPFAKLGTKWHGQIIPGCKMFDELSDDYWKCYIRHYTYGLFHQSGTCKMGSQTDPLAVVDSRLRVYGVEGLRVADVSISPSIITGHTMVPAIMIVGAGASGGALASRLSEDKNFNVLLLEAGGEPQFLNTIPYFAPGPFGGELDWGYQTESQKHACLALVNEQCPWPQGKGLGGSTLINALVYNRADPSDYDNWEKLGNEGWSYDDVLPYFKKLEDFKGFVDKNNERYHGFGGPMLAARPPYETELARVIIEAGQELGYSEVDYNGQAIRGFMGLKIFGLLISGISTKIGAGASGGTLASRLSEDKKHNVLLLEAGGEPKFLNTIPYFAPGPFGGDLDWNYETDSQKSACLALQNEKWAWPRGKGLGGSTLINGLVFNRCDPNDYDKEYHGFSGPMPAAKPPFKTELAQVIIEAGQELGYSEIDYNAKSTKGFANPVFILKNGTRYTVYDGYLKEARKRANLDILTGALVEKVEFDGNTAVGVLFLRDGQTWSVKARKEIILSAGAVNTPKILMLSGIGPKETLTKYEIPVIKHLPGVGQNLQDHIAAINTKITLNEDVGFKYLKDIDAANLEKWETKREGPLTVPLGVEGIAFIDSEYSVKTINWPDLEILFLQTPLKFNRKKEYELEMIAPNGNNFLFTLIIALRPKSVGYITIQGKSVYDLPSLQPKYLSDKDDVDLLVSGVKIFQNLTKTKAFQKYQAHWDHDTPTKGCEQYKFLSDEYLACDIRYHSMGVFHQCCTAKMGPKNDPMAVVDSKLRVHGVKKLRVVDMSIPPNVPSGHTMVPSIMIGEKAADMIKEYSPYYSTIEITAWYQLVLRLSIAINTYAADKSYDFIVVGAGASGGALASRLSEDKNFNVLLLEAGGEPQFLNTIPYFAPGPFGGELDWNYQTESQKHACLALVNEQCPWPRGKGLGGSTLINALVYNRADPSDYDNWEKLGNEGWSYDDVLPYFKKLEDFKGFVDKNNERYHGFGGPMPAARPPYETELARVIIEAGQELGYSEVDYNGEAIRGFSNFMFILKNGSRHSVYDGYIKEARKRANLDILTGALVEKIEFNDKTAVGVIFQHDGKIWRVKAEKEIVLSAGALSSPQILMRSGIGPRDILSKYEIPVVANLPGVGQNLQDHIGVINLAIRLNEDIGFKLMRDINAGNFEKWERKREGPLTVPVTGEGIAFVDTEYSDKTKNPPDLEMIFYQTPLLMNFKEQYKSKLTAPDGQNFMFVILLLLRPKSVGYTAIKGKTALEIPLFQPNFLTDKDDIDRLVSGMKMFLNVTKTKAFQKYDAFWDHDAPIKGCEQYEFLSDDYFACYVGHYSIGFFHECCTAKMGPKDDIMAVVNSKLRVYGVKNLRVADMICQQGERQAQDYHGFSGPMPAAKPLFKTELAQVIIEAGQELGYSEIDYNVKSTTVGAGASGGALASRLSEDKNFNVLLLEAGGEPEFLNTIPYFAPGPFGGELDWDYQTESQKHACLALLNEQCPWPRGKGLGGSTLINSLVYNRADPSDYDNWEKLGNEGWSYYDVLPYFKKLEDFKGFVDKNNERYHGFGGPMLAARPPYETELARVIIEAGQELGYSEVDYNGQAIRGFSNGMFILKNGSRHSVYDGYIKEARKRANLDILTGALVEKIEFNDKTEAVGVIFQHDGKIWRVKAEKEIVLSAGALSSPQILMRSGIGPRDILSKYEIPVVANLPGVGQNLQDHIGVINLAIRLNEDIGFKLMRDINAGNFEKWERKREGPLTVPVTQEGIAFVDTEYSDKTKNPPDLEMIFYQTPLLMNFKEVICYSITSTIQYKSRLTAPDGQNFMFLILLLLRPKSVGYTVIKGKTAHDVPLFQPNFLTDKNDIDRLVSGMKMFLNVTKTKAFQKYDAFWDHDTPIKGCEQYEILSDDYLACYAGHYSIGFFHECCTAKMGPKDDTMAVVNSKLSVI